jgi:hypothetical protein
MEGEQHPIAREEWLAYVERDDELRRVTAAEIEANKPFVKPDDAAWIEPRGDGTDKVLAWFGYHKGLIDVRNPHAETLQKMADIAEHLKANVVDENDNVLVDPGLPQPTWREPPTPPTPLAQSVIGIGLVAIAALGLAFVFWLLLRR